MNRRSWRSKKGLAKFWGGEPPSESCARQMLGRTPDSITAVRPLQDGVITDFELCEAMLRYFINKAIRRSGGLRPRVVIAIPGSITAVEKRAVFNSAERAGAGQVFLIPESKAAGIGAGLPISEPLASMVCDIGGGTTDVAVFSLADIVVGRSIRIAGDEMDEAIIEYLKQHYSLRIGNADGRADQNRDRQCRAARPGTDGRSPRARHDRRSAAQGGRHQRRNPRSASSGPVGAILACIKSVIEQCDPELVADLVDQGVVLTGGGALLRGLDVFLSEQLNVPVRVDADPLTTVARGTAICLDHLAEWRDSLDAGEETRA